MVPIYRAQLFTLRRSRQDFKRLRAGQARSRNLPPDQTARHYPDRSRQGTGDQTAPCLRAHAQSRRSFSVERLLEFLTALGQDVQISLRPTRKPHGEVSVVA